MAQLLEPASAAVLDAAGVSAADLVIDVATGTGNAALLAAARGADVLGVDFEPALLALARQRAASERVNVRWLEGDAEHLPAADGQADVVVSVFGVMYAPGQAAAARELVRVLAPSGCIALAAWTPGSLMPAMGAVLTGYLPPPPVGAPPGRWGDPQALETLLADAGGRLRATTQQQLQASFDDPQAAADFLVRTAGHVVSQEPELRAAGRWEALRNDLTAFVTERGERCADGLNLTFDYLIATAERA